MQFKLNSYFCEIKSNIIPNLKLRKLAFNIKACRQEYLKSSHKHYVNKLISLKGNARVSKPKDYKEILHV